MTISPHSNPRLNSRVKSTLMIWALFAAVSDNLQAGKAFEILETLQQELVIQMEGQAVGKYMFKHDASSKKTYHDTYKPFLHVIDPETGITLTKGPGGQFLSLIHI